MVSFKIIVIAPKWLPFSQCFFSLTRKFNLSFWVGICYWIVWIRNILTCWFWPSEVLCPLCVISALVGSMQTDSQGCSSFNTLASGSKHTVCSYCGQQMAMFNYFHHMATLSLSVHPSPIFFCFYPFFLQVLRNRDFRSGLFFPAAKACITFNGLTIMRYTLSANTAIFWWM